MQQQLIWPMAFYFFYIWILAILLLITRVRAFKNKEVPAQYFKALQGTAPEKLLTVGRHFDNQFQVPVLFFITCITYLVTNRTTEFTIILAWAFIATRLAHSYVHLGSNNVYQRIGAFALGWLTLWIMWLRLI